MRLSIITPTHNPEYLPRLAASIEDQTFADFDWFIVPNGDCGAVHVRTPQAIVCRFPADRKRTIGAVKRFACEVAQGEILVEVDHDDELTPDALMELHRAFLDPEADFVYSNWADVRDGNPATFSEQYGWRYRPFDYRGQVLSEAIAFPPGPATFSRIWYAPNHVRAWRRSFYEKIGGHSPDMDYLDDQDLMIRSYLAGKVRHIDKCLYIYHLHDGNSFADGDRNAKIQLGTMDLYDRNIYRLAERWAELEGLRKLDICSGPKPAEGNDGVDLAHGPIFADLDDDWPFETGSVGVIRAHDALEHLRDPVHTMQEAYRVLAPGGWLLTQTPSTDGRGAFQDPTHVSYWNENSFWYYTRAEQAAFIGTPVRFQAVRVKTYFPNAWCSDHNIPYVAAHLAKPCGHWPGKREI